MTAPSAVTAVDDLDAQIAAELRSMPDRQLAAVAFKDPITGAWRRDALPLLIDQRRTPAGWVVVFVDLDGMKAVNDTCGHGAGDALLAYTAAVLTGGLRDGVLFRWGGDEFVILAATADPAGDAPVVEQRTREVLTAGNVRASVGSAPVGEGGVDLAVAAADQAMYRDKETRKCRTTR